MKNPLIVLLLVLAMQASAQETFPVNGVHDPRTRAFAFTHATIVVNPEITLNDATLLIREGKIADVGTKVTIPADAVVIDLKGKYIYPSFIDLDADYGLPPKPVEENSRGPQMDSNDPTAGDWNQAVTPQYHAEDFFFTDTTKNKSYRAQGFGSVLTSRHDGIARGTGTLVMLGDERSNEMVIMPEASADYSFDKGSSTQDYPSSQMGVIALLRQTFYDADWYAKGGETEETNNALAAINAEKALPQIIDVNDKLEILRADKIGDEFHFQFIIRAGNNAYQRLDAIKATGATLIIPVNYPKTPDVSDPLDADLLTYAQLKHWELAPANAMFLEQAGIPFAFTETGSENDFLKNVRKAIAFGLSEKTALAALTTIPANLIHASAYVGTLEKGKLADFLICSGNIFDAQTILFQNWINGKEYDVNPWIDADPRGIYLLHCGDRVYGLLLRGKMDMPEFAIIKGKDTLSASGSLGNGNFSIIFKDSSDLIRLSGWQDGKNYAGTGQINADWIRWLAEYSNPYMEKKKSALQYALHSRNEIMYPFSAYGWTTQPKQEDVLFTNATVWTNEDTGVLKGYDVLISRGKIIQVGKNISAKNARVVDCTGKYLTCGIVDEHSHIAISGDVNEGTHAVTSEVRIGDVLNSEDIQIYRQLAGGVTTSHILHGSANPIGGQTQVIKLRWGATPEQMKFAQAPPFIKFALGENVKQSNWGDDYTVRFPQTRMGIQQVYIDAFTRAQAYIKAQQGNPQLIRTDLELEALAEILEGTRYITCHSYVQSEINMLMSVAQQFHFTVNTFTHDLEGYKVADKMKAAGSGGSTFSDWWDYKFEVYNAIPYNAAILTRVGVVTAVNSDDPEMARRLNQEAAKSIKYGGLSEAEAWKLCTLNPAKLLHIDQYVGSIKTGKDADLVVWSDDPLSIYAQVEMTFVDGICYFSLDQDAKMRTAMEADRGRIIAKMILARKNGDDTAPADTLQGK